MTSRLECVEIASDLLAGGPLVARHLAGCEACRGTAATLAVVRRSTDVDSAELWSRVRARLADDVVALDLRFQLPGWRAAVAVAAIVVATALAPEPGRLLAVMLGVV